MHGGDGPLDAVLAGRGVGKTVFAEKPRWRCVDEAAVVVGLDLSHRRGIAGPRDVQRLPLGMAVVREQSFGGGDGVVLLAKHQVAVLFRTRASAPTPVE